MAMATAASISGGHNVYGMGGRYNYYDYHPSVEGPSNGDFFYHEDDSGSYHQ